MIADYEAAGEAANEFMPYGLSFKHKHLPELTGLCQTVEPRRCSCRRWAISRRA